VKDREGRRCVLRGTKVGWKQRRQIVGRSGGWRIMVVDGEQLGVELTLHLRSEVNGRERAGAR